MGAEGAPAGGDGGAAAGPVALGKVPTGRLILPDGAAGGSAGASSTGPVAFEDGEEPALGHWKPGMPSGPTSSAGLVGVAALEVAVAEAEVGATGYPDVSSVLDGTSASEVGTMTGGVGSAAGALVSVGTSADMDKLGETYEPEENERIGALVETTGGIVA
jgi:hypothetical protein